ncbi:uncharacterized protein LOC125831450 [Solanum verrucosum]|uniref:uncharacterized protein LOC125831450 n=1 Tax=Solanum verrucosum TaxID=315347 RepID=UPI0020D04B37|nr:uncharacterized protein LOC125831450 [Solanum verrucosum]
MTLVDIIFNYGGEWIKKPNVMYSKKLIDTWTGYDPDLLSFFDIVNEYNSKFGYLGVQQLIVTVPSGNYYEIDGDNGIKQLLYLVSEEFKVLNIYVVNEGEELIEVHNISQHSESYVATTEAGTTEAGTTEVGTDGESDNESDDNHVEVECDSDDLNKIAFQKNRIIDVTLLDYKELCIGMSFKDIPEARLCINLYALVNKRNLKQLKSDPSRLRYECVAGCSFSLHISGDKDMPGVRIKTLKNTHDCNEAFDNGRVDHLTIVYYLKSKLQNDPKYMIKDMRDDLKERFDVNISHGKCKRAKRLILEKLEGSFTDDYNRLEAYANELRSSNPGSDVIINISKDALANAKRRFLRMFICFHALKMGFKDGLRPFIGLDGTFLKGKAKGQLLTAVGQDCQSHSYLIAWAVVDKETKRTWNWFLGHLKRSLDLRRWVKEL